MSFIRKNLRTILAICADDDLIVGTSNKNIDSVIKYLRREFEINTFNEDCFLVLEKEKFKDESIHYRNKILKRFIIWKTAILWQLLDDFNDSSKTDYPYLESVGSLMYLATATRLGISYAHSVAVKRIFKYIKSTLGYGIHFKSKKTFYFTGYSNAQHQDMCSCLSRVF